MADTLVVHSTIIKNKMQLLASLSVTAANKISNEVLSMAAKSMSENMEAADYVAYIASWDDLTTNGTLTGTFDVFNAKEYHVLTDDEKVLCNLFNAESYFGLYHLSVALRKLVNGMVMENKSEFGQGKASGSAYDELIANRDTYYSEAINLLGLALGTDYDTVYLDGAMGCFVV